MYTKACSHRYRNARFGRSLILPAVLGCALLFPPCAWASEGSGGQKAEGPDDLSSAPFAALVELLPSDDRVARTAATKELFRRGKKILPQLREAGAKPIATIRPSRLDVVYSLIEGLEKNLKPASYRADSFGIHLEPGVKRKDLLRMGEEHGFSVPANLNIPEDSFPTLYVQLQPGKDLELVLRSLLTTERQVITVNLNYVVRRNSGR